MADDWGQVRLEGLAQLKRTFFELTPRLEKNVILGALRAAAQVIRKDAMSRAPVLQNPDPRRKAGTVKRSITVKRSRRDRMGLYVGVKQLGARQIAAFKRGSRAKAANNPDDPFYWIFLEFGTATQPARPFLRPAFEAKRFEALKKFEEYMAKRVVKEAEKLAREMGMRAA